MLHLQTKDFSLRGAGRRAALALAAVLLAAPAWAFDVTDTDGKRHRLADYRGKWVVVNFWATWCTPCIEEMPELAQLHLEIAPRNATVLGIGVDSPANVRAFAEKHRFPYPLVVAGMGGTELARQFGNRVGALPFTVVIDAGGRIVERRLGRIQLAHLRETVASTLVGG
jgi:peroxiredoxin